MHKSRKDRVRLQLVLVQKRTRLEFLRCNVGRLYTWGETKSQIKKQLQVQRDTSLLSKYSYKKGDGE